MLYLYHKVVSKNILHQNAHGAVKSPTDRDRCQRTMNASPVLQLNKQLQCTNVNRVPLLLIIIQLLPIHTGIQKLYRPGSPCLD